MSTRTEKKPRPKYDPHTLPAVDPRQRYTIDEGSAYLRQCRAKTYKDIAAGKIKTIKDGSRRYIPGTEIARRSEPDADRARA